MYADHRSKKSVETMNNKDTCISHVGVAVADKLLGPEHFSTCSMLGPIPLCCQACPLHRRTFSSISGFYLLGTSYLWL